MRLPHKGEKAVSKLGAMAALIAAALMLGLGQAAAGQELSDGQTLYVPCYSHIYHGVNSRPFDLAVTLSIHNVDMTEPLTLEVVDYYDTNGDRLRSYLDEPVTVPPLATVEYLVEQMDESGGSGANFIVVWSSERGMNPPLVESVMIGTSSQQGISFTSRGVVLETR